MNIKSLLLGSAAALVAVSGARAADAIYAEPEPVEYVRVCDVYGSGFFYIPGTETCLRVGGYLQYDIGVERHGFNGIGTSVIGFDPITNLPIVETEDYDTYYKRARFQLLMDARSETEWGTLRGYFVGYLDHVTGSRNTAVFDPNTNSFMNSFSRTGTSTVTVEHAYIELGGLRVGATDSLFSTQTGYGSPGAINGSNTHPYGPFTTHQIAYTFGGNGFVASVALENGSTFQPIDDYMPHVVAGVAIAQGWGGISGVVAYDSVAEEWAAKARLDVSAGNGIGVYVMGGYNSGATPYAPWGGEWMVQGGVTAVLSEKAKIGASVGYDDAEIFSALGYIAFTPVAGLLVQPEVTYRDTGGDNEFGGYLRIRRSF